MNDASPAPQPLECEAVTAATNLGGGRAFPGTIILQDNYAVQQAGMSLRSFYAAHALTGAMLAMNTNEVFARVVRQRAHNESVTAADIIARLCMEQAEAMVEEGERISKRELAKVIAP